MAYTKIVFQNSPSTATPLNAENLNHMDDQIALNDQRLTEIETSYVKSFNGRTGEVVPADNDYNIGQIAPLSGAQVGQVPVVVNHGTEQDPELVFEMGAGGGGGHSIIDSEGNTMPQESAMQFPDSHVSDDSTNGRTVVENIKEVASADYSSETEDGMYLIPDGEGAVIEPASDDYVEVTADGVKTYETLLNELWQLVDMSKVSDYALLVFDNNILSIVRHTNQLRFGAVYTTGYDRTVAQTVRMDSTGSFYTQCTSQSNGNIITDIRSNVSTNGHKITLYYGNKKATVDLQTTANRCLLNNGQTVEETLSANVLEATVDLTSYTSSNPYTIPSDGYLTLINQSGATGYGVILGSNGAESFNIGYSTGRFGLFVKKGMKVYCGSSPTAFRFNALS